MSDRKGAETHDVDVTTGNDKSKPASAPPPQQTETSNATINRKLLFRRSTGSKRRQTRKRMSSTSSLHSLASILKPTHSDQRSVPNVSFSDEYNDVKVEESKDSLNATRNPSIGESSSQLHYTLDNEESFRVHGGSFSTQASTIGFRSSFFSVLEKLGVWRSQDLYKPKPSTSEEKFTSERKTARNSITSLYFRTLQGGKYKQAKRIQTFPDYTSIATCCKAQCHS